MPSRHRAIVIVACGAFRSRGVLAQAPAIRLTDVTEAAGVSFTHNNGAFGKKYLPETLGAGAAFFDFDNDGRQDLFLVNGTSWPGQPRPAQPRPRSIATRATGTFVDVTDTRGPADGPVRHGRGRGGLRQRRLAGSAGHGGGPEPPVPQHRQGHVRRRHGAGRPRQPHRLQHVGDVVRLRPRRLARPARLQLRALDAGDRRPLQHRRQAEGVLHAGGLSRRDVVALPQSRQRHLRGRHREGADCSTRRRSRWA